MITRTARLGCAFGVAIVLLGACARFGVENTPEISEATLEAYAAAERAYNDGDADTALAQLELVTSQESLFEPAYFLSGKILALQNRYDESIERLQALLEANPHHIDARKWLARGYRITGDPETAAQVLTPALRLSTEDPELLVEMARVSRELDDIPSALEYYTKALAFSDRLAVAAFELAEVYSVFGVEARARRTLQRAFDLSEPGGPVRPAIERRLGALE